MKLDHTQIIDYVCDEVPGISNPRVRGLGTDCIYFIGSRHGVDFSIIADKQTIGAYCWAWEDGPIAAYIISELQKVAA